MSLQQHPDYHLGWDDAMMLTPIWADECSAEYAAGWLEFWDVYEALTSKTQDGGE